MGRVISADSIAVRIGAQLGTSRAGSPEAGPPGPPPCIPDHEILDWIGGGSYGDVWLARTVTGAMRAVKVIRRCNFKNDRPYEREFRGIVQCEPVSRLHPDLVSILHVGRDDAAGFFFYVMELADDVGAPMPEPDSGDSGHLPDGPPPPTVPAEPGKPHVYRPRTLTLDLKSRGRLPVAEVLRLGVHLADALGHLHRNGLVHRDVKPSNVIFIRGLAKLADIGLVTGKDETRSFVGTEGFVPPEGHGTERADLFSLGRLLYEAATGKDRCEFPELPADLDRWPPNEREALLELNEVLVRACATEASKRHASATEFAADLNLILGGRSIRRAYGVERRLAHARRVSVVAFGVLALATAIVWFQDHARRNAESRALDEAALRQRAESAEGEAHRQLYLALLEQARANRLSRELGQRVATLDAVGRAAGISNAAALRREAFAAFALPDLRFERDIPFQREEISRSLDPGFERFALSRGRGPVEVRNVSDRQLLASFAPATNLEAHLLTWSDDGRFLAFKRDRDPAGIRSDLEAWDTTSSSRVLYARDAVSQDALSFNPRRPELMAASPEGVLRVWELESAQELRQFALTAVPFSVRFSPDGTTFAATYGEAGGTTVVVHDARTGSQIITNHLRDWTLSLAWHPQGRWIAAPASSGKVWLIDPTTGAVQTLGEHKAQAAEVAFLPDGDFLISAGWERELICWDLRSMQRAFTIGINAYRAQFRRDGRECAIHVPDGAKLYEFQSPTSHRQMDHPLGRSVIYGAFSPDDRWFAASGDEFIGVWDLQNPGPAATFPSEQYRVPLFSPDGSEIYGYWEDEMSRWRLVGSTAGAAPLLSRLPLWVPPGLRSVIIVSNELVLTSLHGTSIMPIGNQDMEKVRYVDGVRGWGIASPDGRWLGLRDAPSTVLRLFALPDLKPAGSITNRARIWTFAFSPDGRELAVATVLGLEFYDSLTWRRTRELAVPCERQASILYAPDGESLWFTSDGRTSALRDTRTLDVLLPLPAGVRPLALSSDGHQLAVSVDTRRVQVWDLEDLRRRFRELGMDWAEATSP